MQFVLASHNKKKLAELSAIVSSLGIEIIPLPEGAPEPEENGKTFEENAIIKAKSAAEFTGLPALADARTTAQAASAMTRCSMSRNTAVPSANCRQRSRIQSLIGQML